MKSLLRQIRNCQECKNHLPLGPNPIVAASSKSQLVIVGQAPGHKVHQTGIPWDDQSGDQLRLWLGVSKEMFYNPDCIALIPMGFCFPGKGKTGDLPPRQECAPLWHDRLFQKMPQVKLILLVGLYSQRYYLGDRLKPTLTETVEHYQLYLPKYFPLPHPSPRNNIWQAKNPWFFKDVLPELKKGVKKILAGYL